MTPEVAANPSQGEIGQLIQFQCALGQEGANDQVAFYVDDGSPGFLATQQVQANGSGTATWNTTVGSNWFPQVSVQCRDDSLDDKPKSSWLDVPVKIGLTISPASVAAGLQAAFKCKLGSQGANNEVAFFVDDDGPGFLATNKVQANGSGEATWTVTTQASWKPEVSVQCRDEGTAGQPKSDWKDLTVY